MSFSGEVKEELSRQLTLAKHCRLAELSAIAGMCGDVCISAFGRYCLRIHTENEAVARKCFTLLQKTFNIISNVSVRVHKGKSAGNRIYTLYVGNHDVVVHILRSLKMLTEEGEIAENVSPVNELLFRKACCRRAFIRGAFLASGSISNPEKSYHFEIVCASLERAKQLQALIGSFQTEAKIVQRKKYYIVYMKDGAGIVDLLNIMEAHSSLMDLENIRIVREVRNDINRRVNCETANINKTVSAAARQMEDIQYLVNNRGLDSLPEGLEEIASLRLANPEASLKELGEMLTPPVGKSGINHRLRKLSKLAEISRHNKEEYCHDNKGNRSSDS